MDAHAQEPGRGRVAARRAAPAAARAVGRNAAARKYDLLTALGAHALAAGKAEQRLALRLMTLVTARYNWAAEELACGVREIARLWSVDERTAKREMARLREMGWLELRRAGTRGRVTEYRLAVETVLEATRPAWPLVGPDFAARLARPDGPEPAGQASGAEVPAVAAPEGDSEWAQAQAILHGEDTALYGAWLARLDLAGREGTRLVLRAPSRFHAAYVQNHLAARTLAACRSVDGTISEVRIIAP